MVMKAAAEVVLMRDGLAVGRRLGFPDQETADLYSDCSLEDCNRSRDPRRSLTKCFAQLSTSSRLKNDLPNLSTLFLVNSIKITNCL